MDMMRAMRRRLSTYIGFIAYSIIKDTDYSIDNNGHNCDMQQLLAETDISM